MKESPSPNPSQRISLPALVVTAVVVVVLGAVLLPHTSGCFCAGRMTSALTNGRQIHQSAYRMVLDNAANPDPELGWAGDLAVATTKPVTTTGQYVERIVEREYLDRRSLAKLFAAQQKHGLIEQLFGKPAPAIYPGTGAFDGRHSVFRFYKVREADEDTVLFLATKNFHYGADLDPNAPYGTEGAIIVRKGGDALKLSAGQARNRYIGLMPGGTLENPGEEKGNTLSD